MKANHPYIWAITLRGRREVKSVNFTGRLDEALAHADEMESGVRFVVLEYIITRLSRAKKPAAK